MVDRSEMVELTRRALRHSETGTTDLAPGLMEIPVDSYTGREWERDITELFGRHPVPVALSAELPDNGDFTAFDLGPTPVIVARGDDGVVRTHLNVCRHRGARLCEPGRGNTTRFQCPYHGWRYNSRGTLVGVYRAHQFGDVDRGSRALVALPTQERYGFVWASGPDAGPFDIDDWLGPEFGRQLADVDLGSWTMHNQVALPGANWKLVFDGYLEGYHGDHLHTDTLGDGRIGNVMLHDVYGPHQRLVFVQQTVEELRGVPEKDWRIEPHLLPNHIVFPNMSLAGGWHDTGVACLILPGREPGTSITYQSVLTREPARDRRERAAVRAFSGLMLRISRDEDYPCVDALQSGIGTGANNTFVLGRNEPAVQHQHRSLHALRDRPARENGPGSHPSDNVAR